MNFYRWMRQSVSFRTLVQLVLINVSFLIIALYAISNFSERQINEEIRKRAAILSHSIQGIIDVEGLSQELVRIIYVMGAESDVFSIMIAMEDGNIRKVVAATDGTMIGKTLDEVGKIAKYADVAEDMDTAFDGGQRGFHTHESGVSEYVLSVKLRDNDYKSGRPGVVHIMLNGNPVYMEANRRLINLAFLFSFSTLLALAVSYMSLRRNIFLPLASIKHSIDRRAAGDFSARAPIVNNDEIGAAALALNRMIDNTMAGEARLAAILETAKDAVITIDHRGIIRSCNSATYKIFGYKPEEVLGKNIKMLMPSPYQEHHDQYLANYMSTGKGKVIGIGREVLGMRKGGIVFPIELAIAEIKVSDERLFTGFVRDISDRKGAELALIESKERAESANKAKSSFLATMSHELRTPMNGIIGLSRMLMEAKIPAEERSMAATVYNSAEAMLSLLNDLLDFSKIEAGDLHLEKVDFDLHKEVEEIVSLLLSVAKKKNIKFSMRIGKDVPRYINGDPVRVRQVLFNLVGNAIKFTDKGEVAVHIDRSDAGGALVFSVSDTGIGMRDDVKGKVFQKFFQADSSISRRFGGTGLGLSISKMLVDLMGGTISFESTFGKGSVFRFKIPLVPATEVSQMKATASPSELPPSFGGLKLQSIKILIVDDYPTNQLLLGKLLRSMGFAKIDEADSGERAVEMACTNNYDVIFMDCHLPGLSGIDATVRIYEYQKKMGCELVPVIAITADVHEDTKEKCQQAGMNYYLTKPIRKERIIEAIVAIFDKTAQGIRTNHIKPLAEKSPVEEDVIDISQMRQFSDGDREIEKNFFDIYAGQARECLASLELALQGDNDLQWKGVSHKLKGASANIGAAKLAGLCLSAEQMDSCSIDERRQLLEKIRSEFEKVLAYIAQNYVGAP